MNETIYGATEQDWTLFADTLGLEADLLPVVSNPNAEVHPRSKLSAIGKVPSKYVNGMVSGIPNWTEFHAKAGHIEHWRQNADYGICVQTRRVRALDIDVDDDRQADAIARFVSKTLVRLPKRYRHNSGKCLLAFQLDGEFSKRKFDVDGGVIEFLADGQQFIAAGTHPSGFRYVWDMPEIEIPFMTPSEFEAVWSALVEEFGVAKETRGSEVARRKGPTVEKYDVVAEWLHGMGLVLQSDSDRLYIDCPWKDKHTSDSGVTQTAYFLAGTNGYEMGHFKCMHASCAHEYEGGDHAVLSALGHPEHSFEDLGAPEKPELPATRVKKGSLSQNKQGIEATLDNLVRVLADPESCGMHICFDEFSGDRLVCPVGESEYRRWQDVDLIDLRLHLERGGFVPIGRELMRDAFLKQCDANRIDTAKDWLAGLKWDGVERCEKFFVRYAGVEDSPYARAVGMYFWTALAGRVLTPGLQCDMMPVLCGGQGAGKSSLVRALVEKDSLHGVLSFDMNEDNMRRTMQGRLVLEVSELQGFGTKAIEAIKAFISNPIDSWRPIYTEAVVDRPRRNVLLGTTNDQGFLGDPTGARRFLPMVVGDMDVSAVARDRRQLWAEAADLYLVEGLAWEDAYELAKDEHSKYAVEDVVAELLDAWLDKKPSEGGPAEWFKLADAIQEIYGLASVGGVKKSQEMHLGRLLRSRGYERKDKWSDGKIFKMWHLATSLPPKNR
jgi:hypothetical protein